jgi:hypothetical protein
MGAVTRISTFDEAKSLTDFSKELNEYPPASVVFYPS